MKDGIDINALAYAHIVGFLWVHADTLRETLKLAAQQVAPEDDYLRGRIKRDIELTDYLDDDYQVFFDKSVAMIEAKYRNHRQDDRTVSGGKVKTATGYVEEPTCTDKADFK